MTQLLLGLVALGISGSCYPFEILAALQVLTGKEPNRGLFTLLLAYNLPVMAGSWVIIAFLRHSGLRLDSSVQGALSLVVAILCLGFAGLAFARRRRHHPERSHKPSPIAEFAARPVLLGLALVVLNPSVFAFGVAGFSSLDQASLVPAIWWLLVLLLAVSLNTLTLVSMLAFAIRPAWFRARFADVEHWVTHHGWQIIVTVLLLLGAYSSYQAWSLLL
jgi:Sap, sulfolipid-1-addressing protein